MKLATAQQMRDMDRIAIEERGIPSTVLMERAARGVADAVLSITGKERGRCALFCGTGNNGGDGVAAARLLHEQGWEVDAFLVGDREKMTPDTAEMARRLSACGVELRAFPGKEGLREQCSGCDAFVDSLFGIGLVREVKGLYKEAIELMNSFKNIPAISADIPSGVETDTGRVLGMAVEAAATVTFTLPKAGLLVGKGSLCTGRLIVHSIGIPEELINGVPDEITLIDGALVSSLLPRRPRDGHKGTFGKVQIFGGSVGYTGAPVMAARGALRSGAGLVYLSVPQSIYPIVAIKCDEVMPAPLPVKEDGGLAGSAVEAALRALEGKDACLIGPGLGRSPAAEGMVLSLLEGAECPVVLDADGLNAVCAHMDKLDQRRGRATVLTPHDGEFARLGCDLSSEKRLQIARQFAADHGCILVLKGRGTIVAAPDGRVWVNPTGNSGMAKGGSGDVLGGMILSLMGQGMESVQAAVCAVWLHGRAGDLAAADKGEHGMLPTDLIEQIPYAIREVNQP